VIEELPNVSCSAITFSPDGSRFAYVVSSTGARATLLRTANADGADDRELAFVKDPSFFMYPGSTLAWSPDGRSIAVATKFMGENGDEGAVMRVDSATGQMERMTTRKFPWVENVAWHGASGAFVFAANEDAASPVQFWQQQPGGEPVRVTNDLNWYSSIGLSTAGDKLLTVQNVTTSGLWTAPYDGSIGEARQIATEMDDYGEVGWTPDGKVVYRSTATGKQNLWSITDDGSSPVQISVDTMPDKGVSVSPDGRHIVFSSFRGGRYNLWRVNTDGTGLTQLTDGPGEVYPRFMPDGRSLIYQHGTGGGRSSIRQISVDGGEPTMVVPEHAIFPALSPDGARVAYFYMDRSRTPKGEWRIGIAETSASAVIQTLSVPEDIIGRVVRWTPDGASIVYAKSNGNVGNLWRQPLDGGPPVQITNFDSQTIGDFAWSRDGRHIAITRSVRSRDAVLISPK
jgi:Tol biopolymer transport system component